MRGRLEALQRGFTRSGLAYQLVSSGALFAYVKHPFTDETAKQVAMRLAGEHDVLCLPGRIAFANAEASDMETLIDRLIESQK